MADPERIGFPVGGGGEVVDPPLGEARRRFDAVSGGGGHPREEERRRDLMDAAQYTFREEAIAVLPQLCFSLLPSYIYPRTLLPHTSLSLHLYGSTPSFSVSRLIRG